MAPLANHAAVRCEEGAVNLRSQKPLGVVNRVAGFRRRIAIADIIGIVGLAAALQIGAQCCRAADAQLPPVIRATGLDLTIGANWIFPDSGDGTTQSRLSSDPRLQAATDPAPAATQTGNVNIVNNTGSTIYVGFAPQTGSSITWGSGCLSPINGLTVEILADATCNASVTDSVASPGSRFCAATTVTSTGLNCWVAQQNQQTIIETYFQPGPCFGPGTPDCIWYNISIIPSNCTDQMPYGPNNSDWQNDACGYTGGASYNLPVMMSCAGGPTFNCQGAPFTNGPYALAGYPSNCGNPAGTCIGGTQQMCTNGVEAYFYPMSAINSNHQPVGVCTNGQPLTITFLGGR